MLETGPTYLVFNAKGTYIKTEARKHCQFQVLVCAATATPPPLPAPLLVVTPLLPEEGLCPSPNLPNQARPGLTGQPDTIKLSNMQKSSPHSPQRLFLQLMNHWASARPLVSPSTHSASVSHLNAWSVLDLNSQSFSLYLDLSGVEITYEGKVKRSCSSFMRSLMKCGCFFFNAV